MSPEEATTLLARIQRLEDRAAILEVLAAYGQALDYGDVEALLDCFTPDAVRETRRPDGSVNRWTGEAGTETFARTHTHAPELYHKHVVVDTLLTLDGDEADAVSYMFRFEPRPDGPSFIWGMGRYLDHLQRGADGRWRISHRVAEIEDQWEGRSVLRGTD